MPEPIVNHYEPKSHFRTFFGVLASLLSMGIPIGLTELLRAGGDMPTALWSGVASVLAIICAWLSIRGTLSDY